MNYYLFVFSKKKNDEICTQKLLFICDFANKNKKLEEENNDNNTELETKKAKKKQKRKTKKKETHKKGEK